MPTPNLTGDFMLNGLPYMLARDPQHKALAWQRTGVVDSLSTTKRTARAVYGLDDGEDFGGLPDELDHPEVYDDWSGGYGTYRRHLTQAQNHYHVGLNFDTRFPRQLFHCQQPNLLSTRYASVNLNADFFLDVPLRGVNNPPAGAGTVLAVGKGYVAAFTPTNLPYTAGSAFDMVYEATGGGARAFGHRAAVFGSYTYIGNLDGSGFYQRGHDGTTYTLSDCMPARWFRGASGRMWRGYKASGAAASGGANGFSVQSCAIGADPLITANWSATLNLGNGQMVSEDAMNVEDRMFVGFPDGVYMGDQTGTFNNVATDIGANVNADSVRDMTVHNGMVVFPEGAHVWGYRPPSGGGPSALRQLWPNVDIQPFGNLYGAGVVIAPGLSLNGVSIKGTVRAVRGFGRWLYAGVFTGTHSVMFCGYEASLGLPYVWHPMQLLPACKVSRIHVDAITASSGGAPIPRRLWVATDASFGANAGCTAPIYQWPIPAGDESPLADAGFSANYAPFAALEHGITDYGAPGTWKVHRKIEWWWQASSGSLGYDPTVLVTAPIDVAVFPVLDATMRSSLTSIGGFGNYMWQPLKDTLYFKNVNNDAVAQQMNFGIVSEANYASLMTPLHHAFVVRSTFRPRSNDTITAKVRIADHIPDRQGNEMRDGATMLAELRSYANSSSPYVLQDIVGATLPVVVMPPVDEDVAYQGGSDYPEIVATVKLGVLDASWGLAVSSGLKPRWG